MSEILDILKILRSEAASEVFRKEDVEAGYLFGSRAAGRATAESDIDLAVLFAGRGDPARRFRATSAIRLALQPLLPASIDIVSLDDADPLVAFEAFIEGKEVFHREGADLFAAEMRLRRRFEEACHIQRFYTDALRERLGA